MENLSIDISAEVKWSQWSRCESSFSMLLAPNRPGVLALAEDVLYTEEAGEWLASAGSREPAARAQQPERSDGVAGPSGRKTKRMLALFYVAEAYDISAAISEVFSLRSPYREQLETRRCFARYAMISDPENRRAVVNALRTWMATQTEAATGITDASRVGELTARVGSLEPEARAQQRSVAEPSINDVNCDCDPADCTHAPRSGTSLKRREPGSPARALRASSADQSNDARDGVKEPLGRQAFPAGF